MVSNVLHAMASFILPCLRFRHHDDNRALQYHVTMMFVVSHPHLVLILLWILLAVEQSHSFLQFLSFHVRATLPLRRIVEDSETTAICPNSRLSTICCSNKNHDE